MGFHAAACERALQVNNNSLHRAIEWLLSNPDQVAAAASGSIFSMGFDECIVRRALQQAVGDEQRAVNLILNGEVRESPAATGRDASPPPPRSVAAAQQPPAEHSGEFTITTAMDSPKVVVVTGSHNPPHLLPPHHQPPATHYPPPSPPTQLP